MAPDHPNAEVVDEYLKTKYFDARAPGSYAGVQKIWSAIRSDPEKPRGLNKKRLEEWLNSQEVYQVHKEPPKHVPTESIIVDFMDEQWDIDILVMPVRKGGKNQNYRYLLGCIDLFSRFVWARLLRSKSATEVARAFKDILGEGRKCMRVRSDNGGEFRGRAFQDLLQSENIHHIVAYGHIKANFIERWFKTFQMKYYRYAYHANTSKFIDIVQNIVASYNNTIHGTTKMRPSDVNPANALELYDRVYTPVIVKRAQETVEPTLSVGDLVRISLFKDRFKRSYTQHFSEEVFEIFRVILTHPVRFRIRDLQLSAVEGSFYRGELKRVNASDVSEINWKIERVISSRRVKGRKKSLVKWFGYPSKFNTLLNTSDIGKYIRRT